MVCFRRMGMFLKNLSTLNGVNEMMARLFWTKWSLVNELCLVAISIVRRFRKTVVDMLCNVVERTSVGWHGSKRAYITPLFDTKVIFHHVFVITLLFNNSIKHFQQFLFGIVRIRPNESTHLEVWIRLEYLNNICKK